MSQNCSEKTDKNRFLKFATLEKPTNFGSDYCVSVAILGLDAVLHRKNIDFLRIKAIDKDFSDSHDLPGKILRFLFAGNPAIPDVRIRFR